MTNPVSACGLHWSSQSEAARHFGVNRSVVCALLRKGKFESYVRRRLGLTKADKPASTSYPSKLEAIDGLIRDQEVLLEKLRSRRKEIAAAENTGARA